MFTVSELSRGIFTIRSLEPDEPLLFGSTTLIKVRVTVGLEFQPFHAAAEIGVDLHFGAIPAD